MLWASSLPPFFFPPPPPPPLPAITLPVGLFAHTCCGHPKALVLPFPFCSSQKEVVGGTRPEWRSPENKKEREKEREQLFSSQSGRRRLTGLSPLLLFYCLFLLPFCLPIPTPSFFAISRSIQVPTINLFFFLPSFLPFFSPAASSFSDSPDSLLFSLRGGRLEERERRGKRKAPSSSSYIATASSNGGVDQKSDLH